MSSTIETLSLANELLSAYSSGSAIETPPSARSTDFDLTSAYAVEAAFASQRIAAGHRVVGLKVGFANKAAWRILKLETLAWAHMYDDTVQYANWSSANFALPPHCSLKIEPEIVFKLKDPVTTGVLDAATVLQHVEWLAAGFEIIDCPFPAWKFAPADFIAAFGLHRGLVVGEPLIITPGMIPALVENLASFKVKVSRDGELIEEGSGKNSLRSPALCLAELAGAILRQTGAVPLGAGDLVSSGTLTAGHPIAPGEVWHAEIDGLPVSNLTLRLA